MFVSTTVTANRNIVILAISYRFDPENMTAWEAHLTFSKKCYPCFDDAEGVSISDGDKGIALAHLKVFPLRGKFRCYEHKRINLLENATGLSTAERGDAIAAYTKCVFATTLSAFDTAWNSMPAAARRHFPENQWQEYFPVHCTQKLHNWYTSSCAESENNSLATARSQDPFNALLTVVELIAERQAKQQRKALDYAAECDVTHPGVPPAVVEVLKPTLDLADQMSSTRTVKMDGVEHVYTVGRLSDGRAHATVALVPYTCCSEVALGRYPCHHMVHVCSAHQLRLSSFMPKCHTESTWRAQIGLEPRSAQLAGQDGSSRLKACCPLPNTQSLLCELPKGTQLRLVIAVRPGELPSAQHPPVTSLPPNRVDAWMRALSISIGLSLAHCVCCACCPWSPSRWSASQG